MSDGKGGRHSFREGDPRTIELADPGERAYWCKSLMVDEVQLRAAIAAVGTSAEQVKRWLEARHRDR